MTFFLKEYGTLYGKQHLTYKAHLLLHLVNFVRDWGHMNGRIVQFLNGKAVCLVADCRQVLNYVGSAKALQ